MGSHLKKYLVSPAIWNHNQHKAYLQADTDEHALT